MKRALLLVLPAVLLAIVPAGCEDKKKADLLMPPLPRPRYLSPEVEPKAEGPSDKATAKSDEKEPAAAADRQGELTNEEIAARLAADAEAVMARRGTKDPDPAGGKEAGGDDSPAAGSAGEAATDRPAFKLRFPALVKVTRIEPADDAALPAEPKIDTVPIPPERDETPAKVDEPPPRRPAPERREPPTGPVTLDGLTKAYEAMARDNPNDADVARTLRILYFLSGQDERSLEAIAGLPAEEQTVWRGLIWTLINARDRQPGMTRAAQAAEVLTALNDVRTALQKQAPLELGEVRFCQSIDDFGNYVPLAVARFRRGEQALLYTELRNFATDQGEDGLYHVRLKMSLALERPDGTAVWNETVPNIDDVCRTPRQDFFLSTLIPLPRDLRPGQYVLRATFEDTVAHKQAATRLELEVTGPQAGG